MTLKQYSYADVADATVLTSAIVTAHGSTSSAPYNAGGGSITVRSAAAGPGSVRGLRCITGTTGATRARHTPNASSLTMARTTEIQIPVVLPTGTNVPTIWALRATSGSGYILRVIVNSAGNLFLQTLTGSNISLGTYAAGTKLRLAVWVVVGTGIPSANGVLHARIYNTGGSTPLISVDLTNRDLGDGAAIDEGDIGISSTFPESYQMDYSSDQWDDGRTSEIPAMTSAANVAPTAAYDVASVNVAAGATVSSTLTGTDPDGTIASYSHTVVYPASGITLTGASTATCSFTAPAAGGLVILSGTVTDNNGAVSPAVTKEIRVPMSGEVTPLPTASTGGFTRVGSASSDGLAMADTDDTTYMESGALSGSVQTLTVRAKPATTRSALTPDCRIRKSGAGTGSATFKLLQGTVEKGSFGPFSLTDIFTDFTFDLTSGQIAAITDWGNLVFRVDVTS